MRRLCKSESQVLLERLQGRGERHGTTKAVGWLPGVIQHPFNCALATEDHITHVLLGKINPQARHLEHRASTTCVKSTPPASRSTAAFPVPGSRMAVINHNIPYRIPINPSSFHFIFHYPYIAPSNIPYKNYPRMAGCCSSTPRAPKAPLGAVPDK